MTSARRLSCLFRAALASVLLPASVAPVILAADANWDATVLGRILAEAPPDARLIRVGDMLLPRGFVEASLNRTTARRGGEQPESAFAGMLMLWTGGIVPYDFAADVTAVHQQAFVDAARDWSAFAHVTFVRRTSEVDYVLVQNMLTGGGLSAVGKAGGAQDFKIGSSAWNRGTLNHELGHVLGMVHEHQRSDRDLYVTINTANLMFGPDGNFVELADSNNQGPYDFDSVMHYSKNAFAIDTSQDTIDPLPAYAQYLNTMGNHFDRPLSPLDRQKMAVIYGPGPAQTSVVTNTQDSGPGSLRAAIYYAVDHPGTIISFNIPNTDPGLANNVFTIQPSDLMTTLGAGTAIDGASQPSTNPNGPSVVLSGLFAHAESFFISGLRLTEANCTVRGLLLNNFTTYGIEITGPGASGNTVAGCYFGTDATATNGAANSFAGVGLTMGAHNNTIGGTTAADRNILSGSATQGIYISDAGTNNNLVTGNYIGLDRTGSVAVPNADCGVGIFNGAQGNVIGGFSAGARNIISGNTQQGIVIRDADSNGNFVFGNYVGTNSAGTAAVANGNGGIAVFNGAQSNTIGFFNAGAGNLVSGNVGDGIFVGYAGTNNNTIQGNLAGTDATGLVALPNSGAGVTLYAGAQSNLVGGLGGGEGNVCSGNGGDGIFVGFAGTNGNTIQGNLVGLNRLGTAQLPNGGAGVDIYSGPVGNIVGGALPGAGNVISGNGLDGVFIGYTGTMNNAVAGNLIGLDGTGTFAVPNGRDGVSIYYGPQDNAVGGGPGTRNFISGNHGRGVVFSGFNDGVMTTGNYVQGNTIGLNVAGAAVANPGGGIVLFGGVQNNSIGSDAIGAGNLISGNGSFGIALYDDETTGNTFQRNSIFHNVDRGIALQTLHPPQVAPVLTSAQAGLATTITGSLASATVAPYRLEFFATPTADTPPAGSAIGRYFLGEARINADGTAPASFTVPLVPAVPGGYLLTCTATSTSGSEAGSTSEFSNPVTVAPPQSTLNDGIPDAWKTLYGLPTGTAVAGIDSDGTGMTNLQKYQAGLNPKDPHSFLRVTNVTRGGAGVTLTFPSVTGIIYRVERRTDLLVSGWTLVADEIVGTGASIQINDLRAIGLQQAFYRVSVLP